MDARLRNNRDETHKNREIMMLEERWRFFSVMQPMMGFITRRWLTRGRVMNDDEWG